MSTRRKTILAVVILLAIGIVGMQVFLAVGLTDSLRKWVLPIAKDHFHLDIQVDHLSVNLLAGGVTVYGVQVANPAGYTEPNILTIRKCGLNVGLMALLHGGMAEIQKASVKDAQLVIVRNRDGRVNWQEVSDAIRPAVSGAVAAVVASTPAPSAASRLTGAPPVPTATPPEVLIKQMDVKTLVRYLDNEATPEPWQLDIELRLDLKNVANYGPEDLLSGMVDLQGAFLTGNQRSAFDLNGKIAPVTDPTRLSFDVTGALASTDLVAFRPLMKRIDWETGRMSGSFTLVCKKGVFDEEKSVLRLSFEDVRLTEKRRKELRGLPFPEKFKVIVPVCGTLVSPNIDVQTAIRRTLLSDDAFDSIIKGIFSKKNLPDEPEASPAPTAEPPAPAPTPDATPAVTATPKP